MDLRNNETKQFFLETEKELLKLGYDKEDIDIAIGQFKIYKMQEKIKEMHFFMEQRQIKKIQRTIINGLD